MTIAKYNIGPDHPDLPLSEISKLTGIKVTTLDGRVRHGDRGARLIRPIGRYNKHYDTGSKHGELTITEICNLTGLSNTTVRNRLKRGLRDDELFAKRIDRHFDVGSDRPAMTLKEISTMTKLPESEIIRRVHLKVKGAELLDRDLDLTPCQSRHRTAYANRVVKTCPLPVMPDMTKTNDGTPRYDVGDDYLTVTEIAQKAGISEELAQRRVNIGVRGSALLRPQKRFSGRHHVD